MARQSTQCECSDPGCPVHAGKTECTKRAKGRLYRIDMEDETGTYFCEACWSDAWDSGVFTDEWRMNQR